MSSISLFFATALITATGLFHWAAQQGATSPLARDICTNTGDLCSHPEWSSFVAIVVILVYLRSKRARPI